MARNQIIYTSCMRGIDGVNDGQQIYSYDKGFVDYKTDDVKRLFTYQIPSLQPGVIMTEELAKTMPSAFSYRLFKSDRSAVTLNTYLGRDYMGSAGRFGNHLTHSVVCDFFDMDVYPCELYGSTTLRNSMEYEEVNNPKPPGYLPEVILEKGYTVGVDNVIDFLSIGENIDYLKKMVAAMLNYSSEKKRIVICDETENLIMWIAALHYALPLDVAKKVNFTTYEFDPELSAAQICGVVSEGSRYSVGNYILSGRHYVFDFINNQFSDINSDEALIDFLDTTFSFSYDSLTEFHNFLMSNTTYREADREYYASYNLYSLLNDGLAELNYNQFVNVINFLEEFTDDDIRIKSVRRIIEYADALNNFNEEYVIEVMGYLLKQMPLLDDYNQDQIKGLIVNRIIVLLSERQISEATFLESYNTLDELARSIQLSISAELMKESNRKSLLNVMSQNVVMWKIYFIMSIISKFVIDTNLSVDELYPDRPIGNLYHGITKAVYATGRNNGFSIVEKILDDFKVNGTYLVNIALNIEGFLGDFNLDEMDSKHLWEYFVKKVLEMPETDIDVINTIFAEYKRFEEMFMIFQARINKASGFEAKREIFKNTFEDCFSTSPNYAHAYAEKVMATYVKMYEECLGDMSGGDSYKYAKELLHIAMKMKVEESYVDLLIQAITEYMPLEKPSKEHARIIDEMKDYQVNSRNKKVSDKLLLFCIGMTFEKTINKRDVEKYSSQILLYADPEGANITSIDEKVVRKYFEWMLDKPLRYSLKADDFSMIYDLFKMSRKNSRTFMELCNKLVYEKCKNDKKYEDYSEFIKYMFEKGTSEDIENAGKSLCKLSKQKLEELDEEMKGYFERDRKATYAWDEVKNIASTTNPLLKNLSGLFKRNKE